MTPTHLHRQRSHLFISLSVFIVTSEHKIKIFEVMIVHVTDFKKIGEDMHTSLFIEYIAIGIGSGGGGGGGG